MAKWTDTFLDQARGKGEEQADRLISALVAEGAQKALYAYFATPDDRISGLQLHEGIHTFILDKRSSPSWLNPKQLVKGQVFFKKYALDIMSLLGALSLPYCYAASPGNKAIYYTGKMKQTPGKRLHDTASFIIEALAENSFEAAGFGHIQVNRTRLIHAYVRHRLLHDGQWKASWGVPVNQEDMAGTNLAFSYIILKGLISMGFPISSEEREDFLHVWRYIGYQMHIADELLPGSYEEAAVLEERIRRRHFKPSIEGKALLRDLIVYYQQEFPPLASYFVADQIRYFLGDELAAMMGLRSGFIKDKLIRGINAVRKQINKSSIYTSRYREMMNNHRRNAKRFGHLH